MVSEKIVEAVYRRLISEGGPAEIGSLAALVKVNSSEGTAVVYDRRKILSFAARDLKTNEMATKLVGNGTIVGFIQVVDPMDPCNGAWMVNLAAGPGIGKTLYGLGYAMSPSGILMPDRNEEQSFPAKDAWAKVYRSSRKRKPLDDKDNPATPEPDDDCSVQGRGPDHLDPVLDASYESEGWETGLRSKLEAAHEATMVDLNQVKVERALLHAGDLFFREKYTAETGIKV